MTALLPAPGAPIEAIDTPALVLDLPVVESNIETMHRFFRNRAAKVRNVTKGHKCPALAQRQMAADGSIPFGLCCAKVSEAEVMVDAGALHVRMIEQVVGTAKIERLMGLARRAHVIALVDNIGNVDTLAEAAAHHRITLDVLIEVEIGLNRCGVLPGAQSLALAEHIGRQPTLRLAGLSAHEGTIAISDPEARAAAPGNGSSACSTLARISSGRASQSKSAAPARQRPGTSPAQWPGSLRSTPAAMCLWIPASPRHCPILNSVWPSPCTRA
jgi:D-serine deaminase-like pyridoxal phosphate-dependent protein